VYHFFAVPVRKIGVFIFLYYDAHKFILPNNDGYVKIKRRVRRHEQKLAKSDKKKGCGIYHNPLLFLVAGAGFEPTTFGLCLPLQLSLPGLTSLWSGLSLHPRPNR